MAAAQPPQKRVTDVAPEDRIANVIDWLNFVATTVAAAATVLAVVVAVNIASRAFRDASRNLVLARASYDELRRHQLLDELHEVGRIVAAAVADMHPYWKSSPLVPPRRSLENMDGTGRGENEADYWVVVEQRVHADIEEFRNAVQRSRTSLKVLSTESRELGTAEGSFEEAYRAVTAACDQMVAELDWLDACLMANYECLVASDPTAINPETHPGRIGALKLVWDRFSTLTNTEALALGVTRIQDVAQWGRGADNAMSKRWPAAGIDGGVEVFYLADDSLEVFANEMLDAARSRNKSFYRGCEELALKLQVIRQHESLALSAESRESLFSMRWISQKR